jgi:predicted nucleotidyltransferase
MRIDPTILKHRERIKQIAAQHGAANVRVFGSRARGDARPDSDVDLLVEAGPSTSSWFPAGLVIDLEAVLGCPVDLVTERGLRPELRDLVLREAVAL